MFSRPVSLVCGALLMSLAACAGTEGPQTRTVRGPTSCPPGWVLICESREPLADVEDGEIPEYEYCRCRNAIN